VRILFVVPEQPRTTGNWITALRHQQGLVALGHEVALARNPALRRRLSEPNREIPSPRQEALQSLRIYRSLTYCRKAAELLDSCSSLL